VLSLQGKGKGKSGSHSKAREKKSLNRGGALSRRKGSSASIEQRHNGPRNKKDHPLDCREGETAEGRKRKAAIENVVKKKKKGHTLNEELVRSWGGKTITFSGNGVLPGRNAKRRSK